MDLKFADANGQTESWSDMNFSMQISSLFMWLEESLKDMTHPFELTLKVRCKY